MAYEKRKTGNVQIAMGDTLSDLMKCGQGVIGAAVGGAVDPYLPEAMCRVAQLQALSLNRTPLQALLGRPPQATVPMCSKTPPGRGGMGEQAIKPLRAVVYGSQHPLAAWAALGAIVGLPMLVGYMLGKRSR